MREEKGRERKEWREGTEERSEQGEGREGKGIRSHSKESLAGHLEKLAGITHTFMGNLISRLRNKPNCCFSALAMDLVCQSKYPTQEILKN